MSRYIIAVQPDGRDLFVKRNKAIQLIAEGAVPAGEKNGYECIVLTRRQLVWKKVTRMHMGEKIGMTGMSLVPQ